MCLQFVKFYRHVASFETKSYSNAEKYSLFWYSADKVLVRLEEKNFKLKNKIKAKWNWKLWKNDLRVY